MIAWSWECTSIVAIFLEKLLTQKNTDFRMDTDL